MVEANVELGFAPTSARLRHRRFPTSPQESIRHDANNPAKRGTEGYNSETVSREVLLVVKANKFDKRYERQESQNGHLFERRRSWREMIMTSWFESWEKIMETILLVLLEEYATGKLRIFVGGSPVWPRKFDQDGAFGTKCAPIVVDFRRFDQDRYLCRTIMRHCF